MKQLHLYVHDGSGIKVLVTEDQDGFVAEVLGLPGCVAEGETIEDVMQDITVALEATLEIIREDEPERLGELLTQTVHSSPVRATSTTAPANVRLVA